VFLNIDKPAMRQVFSCHVTRTIAARNWTSVTSSKLINTNYIKRHYTQQYDTIEEINVD